MYHPSSYSLLIFFFLLVLYLDSAICANFSFSSFSPNDPNITVDNGATRATVSGHPSIRLTDNQILGNVFNNTGRAYYSELIQLWDSNTNTTTDFTTYFEFMISFTSGTRNLSSGGIAFFLTSENNSAAPLNSARGWLGLFNETNNGNPSNQMVAVEFDIFQDSWDPSDNHVGINVNSIVSVANLTWSNTMVSGDILGATISYNGTSNSLDVALKDPQVPNESMTLNLTYPNLDLKEILPERVVIGFSASTGDSIPLQVIRNWNFTSTLSPNEPTGGGRSKLWIVGLVLGLVVLVLGITLMLVFMWRKARRKEVKKQDEYEDEEIGMVDGLEEDFMKGTGPKRFKYEEMVKATDNFSENGKLGQGGFGGVYRGFTSQLNMEIAVKKISNNSKQGKKEYISEVKTISRLRHRNLVQLVGYSHERGSFLLVYEYMPNGSLDHHLFKKKSQLMWPARYKIAQGLASGLLYLHEEWEQCVLHRDIKSSNVMLDSNFNAKLGDFGLARLVDHGLGSPTTVLAGTMGYLAPECVITSKASKESDVFSFGVVALEIACGRKAVEHHEEESRISLVNWVWELYGMRRLPEAADADLMGEYNTEEMTCLMIVGLWCAHPDHRLRPSIRQVIQVLNFEAPFPKLPSHMPVPMYFAPSGAYDQTQFSFTRWSIATTSEINVPVISSTEDTLSRSISSTPM